MSEMLLNKAKSRANTISNKVIIRACPNSAQSVHLPDGECLASCAVSQHGNLTGKWG